MSRHLTPAELETVVRDWPRVVAGGLNGSSMVMVVCPICCALLLLEHAPAHLTWHEKGEQ